LANIPPGLKVAGARYPVLLAFAPWPGDAQLGRSIERKNERVMTRGMQKKARGMTMENGEDSDPHPLVTLNLADFEGFRRRLSEN